MSFQRSQPGDVDRVTTLTLQIPRYKLRKSSYWSEGRAQFVRNNRNKLIANPVRFL
jgi:hypothetical protein